MFMHRLVVADVADLRESGMFLRTQDRRVGDPRLQLRVIFDPDFLIRISPVIRGSPDS
jgi:hypothetical protein